MNKSIHFFDLDGTLWSIKSNAWIIDKKKPSKPIIKIHNSEIKQILHGVYKKDDICISYNGKKYWISEDLFDRIRKKRKNIEATQLGISFIEVIDPQYHTDMKILKENIRHLVGVDNIDIGILSARHDEDSDKNLLKTLNEELNNIGITIDKFYYVGDMFTNRITDSINYRKLNVLLEHLIGFKIDNGKFLPIKQDKYDDIHFYDDEPQNINVCKYIQSVMEDYLKATDDELLEIILKILETNKPKLTTNLITNNDMNRFVTNIIELKEPTKYPVRITESKKIMKFDNFRKNN